MTRGAKHSHEHGRRRRHRLGVDVEELKEGKIDYLRRSCLLLPLNLLDREGTVMPLGTCWARDEMVITKSLVENRNPATASCIDIAGVASSILATPTIFSRQSVA